ncbi:MAG TPA: hypothetical protein VFS19_04775 [Planctomycetota bacterium]|nr:hypothetical protein [Planctomycetota bacterium]
MIRKLSLAVTAALLLSAFTCSKQFHTDMPDQVVPPPSAKQLDAWQADFKAGTSWRGDPKRVAHVEIQNHLDVPWKGEAYDAARYEFTDNNPDKPQWGSYVIRRYREINGRGVSYQVQVSRHRDVWYARVVRHYYTTDMDHPALRDKETRRH